MTISPAGVINWSSSVAGKYNITVRVTNTSGRYTEKTFTLTVNAGTTKLNQTIGPISFTPAAVTVGGTTTASATATSGLAATFSSITPTVCTVSGSTVTAIAAGTCTIAANQAGNTSFNAASQVTQGITVGSIIKTTPTITWATPAAITYGTALSATQLNATASVAGSFVYTPASGTVMNTAGNQTLSVVFTPTDTTNYNNGNGNVILTVNPAPPQPPTMTPIPAATISAPAAFSYQVAATDPNGDALAYSLAGNPAGMNISSTGLISWTPSVAGTYTITATATDPGTLKASQIFTLTVNGGTVKLPPVITSTPVTNGYRNGYYYYQAVASDPNGDVLSYSLTTKPPGMTINSSTGLIYWRPQNTGTYSVTVKVTDTTGLSASQSFNVTINNRPSNSSPSITSLPVTSAKSGVLYNYDVNATDSDGDILYYRLNTAPSGMVIDLISGIISWTPTSSQTGSRSVTVEAIDSKGGRGSQSYTIQVLN